MSFSLINNQGDQGWLKSTRNSYLNTGSFPRNHIWICGVLKKSIFAYLKFHICILLHILNNCDWLSSNYPNKNSSSTVSVKKKPLNFTAESVLWAKLILESISESYQKYFIKTFVWLFPVATHVKTQMDCSIQNDQKSHIWIPALLESHKCIPEAQFFHIWMCGFTHYNVLLVTPGKKEFHVVGVF